MRPEFDKAAVLADLEASNFSEEEKASIRKRIEQRASQEAGPLVLGSDEDAQMVQDSIAAHYDGQINMSAPDMDKALNALDTWSQDKKWKAVQPMISEEPIGDGTVYAPPPMAFMANPLGLPNPPSGPARRPIDYENPQSEDYYAMARQNGVDTSTGIDFPYSTDEGASIHLLRGFPLAVLGLVEIAARKKLRSQGIEWPDNRAIVTKDLTTSQPAYYRLDEETGQLRKTLINREGMAPDDVIDFLGVEVPRAVIETSAAAAGAAAGKSPTGSVLLASAGSAAAGYTVTKIQKGIAKTFGVPQSVLDTITDDQAWFDAMMAGSSELVAGAGMGLVRRIRNSRRPLDLTDEEYEQLVAEMSENLKIVERLERETGSQYNLAAGELTGDPVVLVAQQNVMRRAKDKFSEFLKGIEISNRFETQRTLDSIHGQVTVRGGPRSLNTSASSGQKAQQALQHDLAPGTGTSLKGAQSDLAQAEADIIEYGGDVSDRVYKPDHWVSEQNAINQNADRLMMEEDRAWKSKGGFESRVQYNPKTGNTGVHLLNTTIDGRPSPILQWANRMSKDEQMALSKSIQRSKASIRENMGFTDEARALRKRGVTEDDGLEFLSQRTLDPVQVQYLLSDLKRQVRIAKEGKHPDGWNIHDMSFLIDSLETLKRDPNRYVNKSGKAMSADYGAKVIESWDNAARATENYNIFTDKRVVSDTVALVAVEEKGKKVLRYKIKNNPAAVADIVFKPRDTGGLSDILEVTGASPAHKAALGEELLRMYKEKVFKGGKPTLAGHEQFMNDYTDHMDLIFGKEQAEHIQGSGSLLQSVDTLNRKAGAVKRALEKEYGIGMVTDEKFYAGNLVEDMLTNKLTLNQVRNLKTRLSKIAPALWEDIQANGAKWLDNELVKTGGLEVNSSSLAKVLDTQGERLRVLYGNKYISQLQDLQAVLKMIDKSGMAQASKDSAQPAILQLTRALLGPLSKKQRGLTAITRILKENGNKALRDIMTNPKKLAKYNELKWVKPGDFAAIATILDQVGIFIGEGWEGVKGNKLRSDHIEWWRGEDDQVAAALYGIQQAQQQRQSFRKQIEFMNSLPPEVQANPRIMEAIQKQMQQNGSGGTAMDREKEARGVQ